MVFFGWMGVGLAIYLCMGEEKVNWRAARARPHMWSYNVDGLWKMIVEVNDNESLNVVILFPISFANYLKFPINFNSHIHFPHSQIVIPI